MISDPVTVNRFIAALEKIGAAVGDLAAAHQKQVDLDRERFLKQYPIQKEPKDATITRIQTDEEKLKADQGASDEPLEEWLGIREKAIVEKG